MLRGIKSRDHRLTRMEVFLPKPVMDSVTPELVKLGDEVVSKQIFDWVTDAERNVPYLRGGGRDAFGRRTSELVVSEGWKNLQNFGIENGCVIRVLLYLQFNANVFLVLESLPLGMRKSIRSIPELSSF